MLRWLLKSGGYTVFLRVIAMACTLLFVSVLSLWMSKGDFGVLAMVISVATLAAAVGGFGQAETIVREISPMLEHGDNAGALAFMRDASSLALLTSLAASLVVGGYFFLDGYGAVVAASAFAITLLLGLNLVWTGAARSYDKYILAMAPKDIIWRAGAMAVVGLLVLTGQPRGIDIVAPLCALVLLVTVWVQAAMLDVSPRHIIGWPRSTMHRPYLLSGLALMISAVSLTASNTADVFFVGSLMSADAAAEYFPANRLALVTSFFFVPMQLIISPRVAQMMRRGDMDGVKRLMTVTTTILSVACAASAAIIVAGYSHYAFLFGTATRTTGTVLYILVGGYAVGALFGLPGTVLIMAKRQKLLATINSTSAACTVAMLVVTTMHGNLVLVAAAVAGVELLRKISIALAAYRATGVAPLHFAVFGASR